MQTWLAGPVGRQLTLTSVVVALLFSALGACPAAFAQGPAPPQGEHLNAFGQSPPGGPDQGGALSYSDLLAAIDRRAVRSAVLDPRRAEVSVKLADGREAKLGYPPAQDLADRLARAGAKVEVAPGDAGGEIGVFEIVMLALIGGSLLLVVGMMIRGRRGQPSNQAGQAGPLRRETKVSEETRPKVTFRDVAGCDEAVEEVSEFVEFLQDPERFSRVGARMPAGLLLHGPPGTGKTLLAKALAAEAGVDFFAASGAEFVERYVGVGASRIRDLFARGRAAESGAVIFIDELDAVGRRRSEGSHGGNDEYEHTLNQLLIEMDGFTGNERPVCVGATNRLDMLDPALLRPGRFSRQVAVELPSAEGRLAILGVHSRGRPLAREVDLPELADGTAGCSGADLREMLNEAAIMAAREGRAEVTREDLAEGHLRALAGPARKSSPLSGEEREVVARHEAGHALVAEYCETQDATQRVSITPRGRAGGMAVIARRDRALQSERHVHEQLMVLLGGRAAESVLYGHVSSGAADDLQRANAIARHAVMSLGFSPRAGQLTATAGGQNMPLSESTRRVIDEEVERMIADAYRDAIAMVEGHREELRALSTALLANDDLDRDRIAALLGTGRPRAAARLDLGPRPEPALRRQHEPQPSAPVVPLRERRRRRVPRAPAAAGAAATAIGRAALAPARFFARRDRTRPAAR
jgi:cell division protease FtsH